MKSFQRNERLFAELTTKLNRTKQKLIEAKVVWVRGGARVCVNVWGV